MRVPGRLVPGRYRPVMSDLDFGTVPGALAAVGTVGTLVVALVLLRREAQDRRDDREERAREQARLITARAGGLVKGMGPQFVTLFVANRSREPIYELIAFITDRGGVKVARSFLEIQPGEHRFPIDVGAELPDPPPQLYVDIYFIDARGISWHRDPIGQIGRYPERDRPLARPYDDVANH